MPFTANAWRLLALGKSRLKSASRCEIPAARYVVDDDNSDSLGVACEGELKASAMIQHAKMLVQNAYLRCVCMTKCAPDRQKKGKKKASCTWHKACTGVEGLEPSAHGFGVRCSTKLSYAPKPCTARAVQNLSRQITCREFRKRRQRRPYDHLRGWRSANLRPWRSVR